jgi:hypothetical protein
MYDPCYPLGDITVTPILQGYSFTPASQSLTVAPGAVATQNFAATPPAMADSFEPNNTPAAAAAIPFPYSSATTPDPLLLNAVAFADTVDWFTCTPAAGTALAVVISDPTIQPYFNRYFVTVYSSSFDVLVTSAVVNGAMIMLPTGLCDGNPVYILVSMFNARNQVQSYTMQVIEISNPVKFQVAARFNGSELLPNARFVIYDQAFNRIYPIYSQEDGLTTPIYLSEGTALRIECYRYGTGHHLQTQLFTPPPGDSIIYLDVADLGDDALEPNDDPSAPLPLQSLPFTVNATLDLETDNVDIYNLDAGDGQPFKISFTSADIAQAYVNFYDSAGNYVAISDLRDDQSLYVPNDGNPGQRLEIYPNGWTSRSGSYTLQVETAPAYRISGVVQDQALNGLEGQVRVVGTDQWIWSYAGLNGGYELPLLFPPGEYTIAAFVVNYDPGINQQLVTISNADVTVDFTNFLMNSHDDFEPNDSAGTATPILLATDYACSVGGGMDFADFFGIVLSTGDRIRVTLTPEAPWQQVNISWQDNYTSYTIIGQQQPDGRVVLDYTVPQTAGYSFYVNGFAHYSVRVDKLN